jgi:hypothetical protein
MNKKGSSVLIIALLFFGGMFVILQTFNSDNFETMNIKGDLSFNEGFPPWITKAQTVENLSVTENNSLRINAADETGVYESQRISSDELESVRWESIEYETDLNAGNIKAEIYLSDTTNFSGGPALETTLSDGPGSIDMENLNESTYSKVRLEFSK